jgi:hypothetical protein
VYLKEKWDHIYINGHKRKRAKLQIVRALDDEDYVILASLDLSAAFDLVNISLLIKRLRILSLNCDIVNLIKVWLGNRCLIHKAHLCF